MSKIYRLIKESKYAIHDISRTDLDPTYSLPRFNMPFELGLFLGANEYGSGKQQEKNCLILEEKQYDYQKYISDIAGHDIYFHDKNPENAMEHVRNWISTFSTKPVPAPDFLKGQYIEFNKNLPQLCTATKLNINNISYTDYIGIVTGWIMANSPPIPVP